MPAEATPSGQRRRAGRAGTLRDACARGAARLLAALACSLLACGNGAASSHGLPPPAAANVLLLLPSDTGYPWMMPLSSALRTRLEQADETVFVHSEQIDVNRFADADYPPRLGAWLADKYRDTPIHVIVAPGPEPAEFLARHAPAAWRALPVVVLHNPQLGPWPSLAGGVTGYSSVYEVVETVEEARTIFPDLRRVVLVSGAAPDERRRAAEHARELVLRAGVEVSDLGDLRFSDMLERLRALPPEAIVVFLGLRIDAEGRSFVPERALAAVAAASSRPVFSTYETLLGRGMFGGRVTSFEAAGLALANTALRVLHGERVETIAPVRDNFARSAYDARVLARFGVDPRVLPIAAEVRNRTPTLLEEYRWGLLAIVAAFLVQAILIGALLVERERRRRAESNARRSLGQLAHLDRVAAMGELATSLAHELNQPLAAILANAQAARRLLGAGQPDLDEVRDSLDDIVEDDKRAGEVIRRMRALLKKEEFRPEPVDLNDVVRVVKRLLAQDAARRGVVLTTELGADLPPVRGDAVQLQQVVLNLLVNAFEAVGSVAPDRRLVTVRTREQADGSVELSVEDAGPGISGPHLRQLFEPFFTTKQDGLGMGLSISRSILELHGGEIEAANRREGGACFRCTLPRHGRVPVPARMRVKARAVQ